MNAGSARPGPRPSYGRCGAAASGSRAAARSAWPGAAPHRSNCAAAVPTRWSRTSRRLDAIADGLADLMEHQLDRDEVDLQSDIKELKDAVGLQRA
jgi:hypothetical protein